MHKFIIICAFAAMLGSSSFAAAGVIQVSKGENKTASNIVAETISGIIWEESRGRLGIRVKLWDVDVVRYSGQAMGEYNGLVRKLQGERGDQLIDVAQSYIEGDTPEEFSEDAWSRITLQCEYFIARGHGFKGDWGAAAEALEAYIEKAEGMIFTGTGTLSNVSFTSGVTGASIRDAGGLNRYYLDALEALGLAYMRQGKPDEATTKGFNPLQELCDALYKSSSEEPYYDWAMRALRASADYAEGQEDYAGAREAYEQLNRVALMKDPNPSRAAYEAQLKVGFMLIYEEDYRQARARFFQAIRDWESSHLDPDYDDLSRARPPATGWISDDVAYFTAGCYIGQGMVVAAEADDKREWAEALERFSMGLSLFNSDDEIRSMGLLGAADACANLAELNSDDAGIAAMYAKLAGKYLTELTTLLPKTRAAEDERVSDIQATIGKYENGAD